MKKNFYKICSENSLVKAIREFLIGEISSKNEKLDLPNPFKCYSTAYEIMENSYITELTWKVLLKLSDIYYERGNLSKIQDNIFYAKKILYFIADQIRENNLKDKYLKRLDRAAAINRIQFLEKEVFVMSEKTVKVKIFSDGKDVSSVPSLVKQINISEVKIICQAPRKIEIEQDDIIVLTYQ